MSTITFKGGTESDYEGSGSWVGGVAPVAGDTAVIDSTGDPLAMLDPNESGDIFAFSTGDTAADLTGGVNVQPSPILVYDPGTSNPQVYFQYYPDVAAGSQNTPGETIGNQTIDLIGGGSVASLYLQNSTLDSGTNVNVSGTALIVAQFSDQLDGTISVGAPFSVNGATVTPPAPNAHGYLDELDINVRPTGSWTYGNGAYTLSGTVPSVTNNGTINVAAGSALNVKLVAAASSLFQPVQTNTETTVYDFQPTRTQFVNAGTINIEAGGSANIYGAPALLEPPSAENGDYVPAPFINEGIINVDGAAGATTTLTSDEPLVGGTLNVDGGQSTDPTKTTAQIIDGFDGTNIVIANATLDLVEHNHDTTTTQYDDQFSGGSITFADAHGTIALPFNNQTNGEIDTTVGEVTAPIDGFRAGDAIDVTLAPGVLSAITTNGVFSFAPIWSQANHQLAIVETVAIDSFYGGGTATQTVADFTLNGTYDPSSFNVAWSPDPFNDAFSATTQSVTLTITTSTDGGAPCFVTGTLIATPCGQTPVEDLRVGDEISLADGGTSPVRWIGRRRADSRPVRIRAGALDPNVPIRDLLVSPDHALLLDGVLVPAELLVDGHAIVRDADMRVTYHHLELDRHAIIIAEGAHAESYLDTGNRARFGNCPLGYDPVNAASNEPCAETVFGGARLQAIRSRLRAREHA